MRSVAWLPVGKAFVDARKEVADNAGFIDLQIGKLDKTILQCGGVQIQERFAKFRDVAHGLKVICSEPSTAAALQSKDKHSFY